LYREDSNWEEEFRLPDRESPRKSNRWVESYWDNYLG